MKKLFSKKLALIFSAAFVILFTSNSFAQITVTSGYTATELMNYMTGSGVTVTNATLTCPGVSYGQFTVTPGTTDGPGMDSGIVLTSGSAADVSGNASHFLSTDNGAPGDAQLTVLGGAATFNACILEFDLTALGDSIRFNYSFGSEEFTSYTCSAFNDVFGFFISGPTYATPTNIAIIPGTTIPVCINSINCGATGGPISVCNNLGAGSPFCTYFINNIGGTTISYDGMISLFTAVAPVNPGEVYHLKLGVADVSDDVLDSGVFLESPSLSTSYRENTSVANTNLPGELELSPNPAKDFLTCRSKSHVNGSISITDLTGRVVLSEQININGGQKNISLKQLKSGIYSVNFSGDKSICTTKKLVIAD